MWRNSLYEQQAFLVTLISQFEFGLTDECSKVTRTLCSVMVPTLEGDTKSVSVPLRVSLATQDQ